MKCFPLIDIIEQINDPEIRNFTKEVLNSLDDSFYKMPASTTGKYHPEECCREGGLIYHIQRACYFGQLLIKSQKWDADDVKGDILMASLLLHDIGKKEKYNNFFEYNNHPIVGSKMIESFKSMIPEKYFKVIQNCILFHMNIFGPKSAQKPTYNLLEEFTYIADFMASKKELIIKP